jgi:antitoxin component YwqK of YwqJK toxin-antitoxin module
MKALLSLAVFLICAVGFSQEQKVDYKKINDDLIKATYYFADNATVIEKEGFFNASGKLQGEWITYNLVGNKTAIANYEDGKKEGVWQYIKSDKVNFVTYKNNKIIKVEEKTLIVN